MNGMNSGQRYSQRSAATRRGLSPCVRYPAIAIENTAISAEDSSTMPTVKAKSVE